MLNQITMAESLRNVFHVVIGNMQQALQQLEGGEGMDKSDCEFNLDDFWLKLRVAAKCISNEVTKLCLTFSKPPLPSVTELREMLKVLETAYLEMLSTFYSLPKCCGLMLRKEVNMTVLQIMESLTTVVLSLQEKGDKAQKNRLMLTGRVWDACEAVESLPQNNFQVTCKIMQREEGLVLDAVQEIEEAAVLKTQIQALLHMVKQSHYTNEEDNSWIEFLLNAVDHNNNKLQPLLVS
ncbi:hypothetical protein B7P43_G06373 [Cryptotermes secundus]|uniref:Cyclin-D1-binding protein 1-like N-terminal domain-containing protein n=1 Tax=Cryptotermes secundus TaxID=105785 RepID=A0A2J7QBJ8_9NEOP|nr:hypothetical protein B7P43_G06373 [Cryptotermes secundus]